MEMPSAARVVWPQMDAPWHVLALPRKHAVGQIACQSTSARLPRAGATPQTLLDRPATGLAWDATQMPVAHVLLRTALLLKVALRTTVRRAALLRVRSRSTSMLGLSTDKNAFVETLSTMTRLCRTRAVIWLAPEIRLSSVEEQTASTSME